MTDPQKPAFFAWQAEKKILDQEKEAHPELFLREPLIDDAETLNAAGIHASIFGARPLGHIKLFPEDFIVEEVTKDERIHTIEEGPLFLDPHATPSPDEKTVWCDVVKMGIDTIEVVEELSRALGIEKKAIGFGGIKDKHAITAQSLSIRNVKPAPFSQIHAHNFFIKNISYGKGALQIGDLKGNRFTIAIRTQGRADEAVVREKIEEIKEQGFWNFFYLQRFGAPRLISHMLGLSILQMNYEEAVRSDITVSGKREIAYFQNIRAELAGQWGNWESMIHTLERFPYAFREELKMLTFLRENPTDFAGALNQVPEQVRLWVYAYASFCFNEVLSQMIKAEGDVPLSLPLILSFSPNARELYAPFLEAHGIHHPFPALKPFPYIQRQEKEIDTLRHVDIHNWKIEDDAIILDFTLGKASYATTFLSHIFELSSGLPVPEGISAEEIDTKAIIGTGSIGYLREGKFKDIFAMRNKLEDEG